MAIELNLKNFDRNRLSTQPVYTSMIADKYSDHLKNDSYVPTQYR